jgi:hypothetical protein
LGKKQKIYTAQNQKQKKLLTFSFKSVKLIVSYHKDSLPVVQKTRFFLKFGSREMAILSKTADFSPTSACFIEKNGGSDAGRKKRFRQKIFL